jgi:exonuclease III
VTSLPNHACLSNILANDEDIHIDRQLITPSCYLDIEEFSNLAKHHTNGYLSIFNSNSRSLIKNKAQYDAIFQLIHDQSKFKFDILCFEETWLSVELESLVEFNSYHKIFSHKQPNKEGGGLAIYLGEHLEYNKRNDINIPHNLQGLFDCLFIDVQINEDRYTIGVMYRSPSYNTIAEVTAFLQYSLDILQNEHRKVVLLGDLNINLLNSDNHSPTRDFLETLISNNLMPKITLPTRVSHTSATLIDHLFTNINQTQAGTITTDVTDHYSNFILIKTTKLEHRNPLKVTYRVLFQVI